MTQNADAGATARQTREATLITYHGATALGRECSRDDGNVLTSEVDFAGAAFTVALDRTARRVRVEQSGRRIEREIPAGALALENGHWQAYAVAADADTRGPAPGYNPPCRSAPLFAR